jgi:FKBP-type peptidyl-prolyl cis-trans isomerase SlyD
MQIADKTVVCFHYTLSNSSGEELESSRDGEPTRYLHGKNNIIRGLEDALVGLEVGATVNVTLPPEKAYGLRNEQLQQRVPIKHLLKKGKIRAGDVVQVSTEQGQRSVTVLKVGRHSADIDSNHPLAGQELTFDIEVTDIRAAEAEELAHGHAHGPGGHQH